MLDARWFRRVAEANGSIIVPLDATDKSTEARQRLALERALRIAPKAVELRQRGWTMAAVARHFGITASTLRRYMRQWKEQTNG